MRFILSDEQRIAPHRPPAPPLAARPSVPPGAVRDCHNALWSAERQAHFLGWLAETGSVSAACARVGMSRNGAYRLRRKPGAESFAAAWDAALGEPVRRVTIDDLQFLAYEGLIRPRFRGGKYVGSHQKPDNSALRRLIARYDRAIGKGVREG